MNPAPSLLALGLTAFFIPTLHAGHSRSGYLDSAQSQDGRYVVTAERIDTLDKKGKRQDHRWEFRWLDRETGETCVGELPGLGSGTSDVFDPVNAHLFTAPDGETFALWIPQAMARSESKKPATDDRSSEAFRTYSGFGRRLTIFGKNGELVKRFDLADLLEDADWDWMHFHQRQAYWLVEYDKLDTRKTPRAGYALYRISPDYTVLEFQIGANQEATHKAKARGVTPPEPRTVRVRLTDGAIVTDEPLTETQTPVRPFVGELAGKEHKQFNYRPSLDPVRLPGKFVERERTRKPVILGNSEPELKLESDES